MADETRSCSTSERNGAPGATRCRWPMTSSSVFGLNLAASGPDDSNVEAAAAANRSPPPVPEWRAAGALLTPPRAVAMSGGTLAPRL